jgi:signal transduction histidine kinase
VSLRQFITCLLSSVDRQPLLGIVEWSIEDSAPVLSQCISMQPLSLKLSHKGFVLVSVPLIFGVLIFCILSALLAKAEQETEKQARSKEIISESSNLSRDLLQAGYYLVTFQTTHSSMFEHMYDDLKATKIPAHYRSLENLTKDKQQEFELTKDIEKIGNRLLELTSSFKRGADSPLSMLMERRNYKGEVERAYQELVEKVEALQRQEKLSAQGGTDQEQRAKNGVNQALAAMLGGDLLITCALALYFNRSITGRLSVLSDNAKRLAGRQELNQPIVGADEIADLDHSFHEMADALLKAEQRKQEFVAMISHDLRAPLSSLQANLDLIERGLPEEVVDDKQGQLVATAKRNTSSMLDLVNGLLDIDKLDAGMLQLVFEEVTLAQIVDRAIEAVQYAADKRKIVIEKDLETVTLRVDSQRLTQVLVNLLSNALKYSSAGSKVRVIATKNSNWLTVKVKDQGRGIPPEALNRIFQRFQMVDESDSVDYKGIGLGLAICKALVEAHHGQIGAESERDKGSIFWFRIPCTPPVLST